MHYFANRTIIIPYFEYISDLLISFCAHLLLVTYNNFTFIRSINLRMPNEYSLFVHLVEWELIEQISLNREIYQMEQDQYLLFDEKYYQYN